MSNFRTFYRRAAILIQRNGWCQGHYSMHGANCAKQAIATAMGIMPQQLPNQVVHELHAAMAGKNKGPSNRSIAEKDEAFFKWHDHPSRTADEVINMLITLGAEPDTSEEEDITAPEPQAPPRRKRTIRRQGPQTPTRQLAGVHA